MSIQFTSSFAGRSNTAEEQANDHEESQTWETGSAEELPDSQLEYQSSPTGRRTFPDEIPDSQEETWNSHSGVSRDEELDYAGLDYNNNNRANDLEQSHGNRTFHNEIRDSHEDPDKNEPNGEIDGGAANLPDELPYDTPRNGRQLHFYDRFNNNNLVNPVEGGLPSPTSRAEVPETQEDTQHHYPQNQSNNGCELDLDYNIGDSGKNSPSYGSKGNHESTVVGHEKSFHQPAPPDYNQYINFGRYSILHHHQEVTDSQADRDLDEGDPTSHAVSYHTEATEIIPGGTQLTHDLGTRDPDSQVSHIQNPKRFYPLHSKGFDVNGRKPSEAFKGQIMEETATQPTTQPQLDGRCLGMSRLSKQDEGDIVAILHPTSPAAHIAVNLTAQISPQHIHQNHDDSFVAEGGDIDSEEALTPRNAQDIALRLSSRVNDIRLGFVFGRNVHKSDILLVREERKEDRGEDHNNTIHAISNKHFRIFINRNGILMLEDTSTNGTLVDDVVLHGHRAQAQKEHSQPRITLHPGAMIQIRTPGSEDSIRFIVGIPTRYYGDSKYNENLYGYLACVGQAERKAAAVAEAGVRNKDVPSNMPVLDNALPAGLQQAATPNTSMIAAGTSGNHHGLHWNGGEKYNVVGHIGSGAFATVCKVSTKRDGEVYAVKEIEKRKFLKDGIVSHKFHNELNVMMNARHPNIIEYKEHHETPHHLYIIMDYMPLGDLRHWTDAGKAMTEYMAARVGRQMLEALAYLHSEGITHRDIKPDNILVAGDDPMDKFFKLADFGLSKQVIDNRTFLQTFCGTLLYLAPEVYPGYERAKAGLPRRNKRHRAQKIASAPYEHSVDIWSLGSVLYQLLAGKPPFTANPLNGGELFLDTVMYVPVDYIRLKYGGISHDAIDFISRMIVTDPLFRAREAELLAHPWLVPKSNPVTGDQEIADVAEGLAASQLDMAEENEGDNGEHKRETKRFRDAGWVSGHRKHPHKDTYSGVNLMDGPPPPQTQSQLYPGRRPLPDIVGPAAPDRLFGEIGSSALRSSGVLGQTANQALEVSLEGTSDEELEGGSFPEQGLSDSASAGNHAVNTSRTERSATSEVATRRNSQTVQTASGPQHNSAAPSLLGAEALVDQLNMASPQSAASASGEFSANPKTAKRSSHALESPEDRDENEKKRSRTGTQTSPGRPRHHSAASTAHQPSSAPEDSSKKSGKDAAARKVDSVAAAHLNQTSQDSNLDDHQDVRQKSNKGKSVSLPATAFNSQDSAAKSTISGDDNKSAADSRGKSSARASISPSMYLAPPSETSDDGFVKPSMRFGNLLLTKGSIKSVRQIKVSSMGTSFGRNPDCTFVHPNPYDRRVPKNAFDIQMWYPGMEKDLAAGKNEWATHPALTAVISTRTRFFIKVNGVRLSKGRDCWLFGKLRTGDVVSVVELPEGQVPTNDHDREHLHFRCEFFIGASKTVRKDGEPFVVEQEDEKYMRHQAKKSSVYGDEGDDEDVTSTTTTTTTIVPTAGPSTPTASAAGQPSTKSTTVPATAKTPSKS